MWREAWISIDYYYYYINTCISIDYYYYIMTLIYSRNKRTSLWQMERLHPGWWHVQVLLHILVPVLSNDGNMHSITTKEREDPEGMGGRGGYRHASHLFSYLFVIPQHEEWHFVEEMTKLFCEKQNPEQWNTLWNSHQQVDPALQQRRGKKAEASPHHHHPAAGHRLPPGSAGWACPDRGTWTPTWCSLPGHSWSPEHSKIKLEAAGQRGNNYENKKRIKQQILKDFGQTFGVKQCKCSCEAVQIILWCAQIQTDEKLFKFWCETIQSLIWSSPNYFMVWTNPNWWETI